MTEERLKELRKRNSQHSSKIVTPDQCAELFAYIEELQAVASQAGKMREALEKSSRVCEQWMLKHGEDWRERLPLWRDTMNSVELMMMDLTICLTAALADSPVQTTTVPVQEPQQEWEYADANGDREIYRRRKGDSGPWQRQTPEGTWV